ncbi:SMEK domain-containing protein [Campylobacter rectus]|uniref:SMEK domain-containing protein n=1 Tax=Campylobacter rectus TaxID=203 RepID=UPI0028DC96CF|nr:SMEK domain-containing protein [Campylobacter rectus]
MQSKIYDIVKYFNELQHNIENLNSISLYDINKIYEDVFAKILNVAFNWKLKNANEYIKNYPAIDLYDDTNKIVIQATSNLDNKKLEDTVEKFRSNDKKEYQLKFFYILKKSNFQEETLRKYGINNDDILGIEDILQKAKADDSIASSIYDILQACMEYTPLTFDYENYFVKVEKSLEEINYDKFSNNFNNFLTSSNQILAVYGFGGVGKSHFLRECCKNSIDLKPVIIKSKNFLNYIEKLNKSEKYLIVYDDIDRNHEALGDILELSKTMQDCKFLISFRTNFKDDAKRQFEIYNRQIKWQQLEISWKDNEIKDIMEMLGISDDEKIIKLCIEFNNNPYLIINAIKKDFDSLEGFAKRVKVEAENILKSMSISSNDFLLNLAMLSPFAFDEKEPKEIKDGLFELEKANILRMVNRKYRFNPDIVGDVILTDYLSNRPDFAQLEQFILSNPGQSIKNLSHGIYKNNSNEEVVIFFKQLVDKWVKDRNFSEEYIKAIVPLIAIIPNTCFVYLRECFKDEKIGFDEIFPLFNNFIYLLSRYISQDIKMIGILKLLLSEHSLEKPKSYYNNYSLASILSMIFSPIDNKNLESIYECIDFFKDDVYKNLENKVKINLFFESVLANLLSPDFNTTSSTHFSYSWGISRLNTDNDEIKKLIGYVKSIAEDFMTSNNEMLIWYGIECIRKISSFHDKVPKIYHNVQSDLIDKVILLLNRQEELSLSIKAKIHTIFLHYFLRNEFSDKSQNILKNINMDEKFIIYQILTIPFEAIADIDLLFENIQDSKDRFDAMQDFDINNKKIKNKIGLFLKNNSPSDIAIFLNSIGSELNFRYINDVFNTWIDKDRVKFMELSKQNITNKDLDWNIKFTLYQKGILVLKSEDINPNATHQDIFHLIRISFIDKNNVVKNLHTILDIIETSIMDNKGSLVENILSNISNEHTYQDKICNIIYRCLELLYKIKQAPSLTLFLWILPSLKENNINMFYKIKNILICFIKDTFIVMKDYELKELYKSIDYELKDILEILHQKLTFKKSDGYFLNSFSNLISKDTAKPNETKLIGEFISSYDDFRFLCNKAYEYCKKTISYIDMTELVNKHPEYAGKWENNKKPLRIDPEYFIGTSNESYVKNYFSHLIDKKDVEKLKILYRAIPIENKYTDIIAKILDILIDNKIDIQDISEYLQRVNKIKSYSRGFLSNSEEILQEKEFFKDLRERVKDCALKNEIDDILSSLAYTIKMEIEHDKERFFD